MNVRLHLPRALPFFCVKFVITSAHNAVEHLRIRWKSVALFYGRK